MVGWRLRRGLDDANLISRDCALPVERLQSTGWKMKMGVQQREDESDESMGVIHVRFDKRGIVVENLGMCEGGFGDA